MKRKTPKTPKDLPIEKNPLHQIQINYDGEEILSAALTHPIPSNKEEMLNILIAVVNSLLPKEEEDKPLIIVPDNKIIS